jgi:hypothetical protein
MFDKKLGGVFRRADREREENVVDRAMTLDASMRALIGMAKAMLIAKDSLKSSETSGKAAAGPFAMIDLLLLREAAHGGPMAAVNEVAEPSRYVL